MKNPWDKDQKSTSRNIYGGWDSFAISNDGRVVIGWGRTPEESLSEMIKWVEVAKTEYVES